MPKQASKVCFSLFVLLISLLENYNVSAEPYDQAYAPTASESATEAEAVAETLSPRSNIPDVETKSSQTLSQDNVSPLSDSDAPNDLQITSAEENLSQELATTPSANIDPILESKGDENTSTSLSPSNADHNPKADPPAAETTESTEDLFQENTSLPPSPSLLVPGAVETRENENVSQENLSSEVLSQETTPVPSSSPYVDTTPDAETSDDGSFTQDNQSPVTYVNAPAPETKGYDQQDITSTQDYSSATPSPPYTEPQNPENVPELNDYMSSLPKTAAPAPSEALSVPESDPTIQMAPTNDNTKFPFYYKDEDDQEGSWDGVNGAVAGVFIGACVIGLGWFVYQKKKNNDNNVRPQYECLAKKGEV